MLSSATGWTAGAAASATAVSDGYLEYSAIFVGEAHFETTSRSAAVIVSGDVAVAFVVVATVAATFSTTGCCRGEWELSWMVLTGIQQGFVRKEGTTAAMDCRGGKVTPVVAIVNVVTED